MPRATPLQPSFNAGEFSLRMLARTDFQKYPLACEVLENMLPLPQGGTTRRPGSVFVAEVKDSDRETFLLPFEFSTEQAYAIEAGEGYFRFYRNQGQIVIPDTDAVIQNGDFAAPLGQAFSHVWQVDDTPAGNAFVDETADANSATDGDWPLLPATEAIGDYAAFGFTDVFQGITLDYAGGTAGVGGTVAWEYWDGGAWTALSDVVDTTDGFTAVAADGRGVSWAIPGDWAARTISTSATLFWVRARVLTTYSTNPVMDQGFVADWVNRSTGPGGAIAHDAGNQTLALTGDGVDTAVAQHSFVIGASFQSNEHALSVRVKGVAGDRVRLRIGTTPDGAEIAADDDLEVGFHVISFIPAAARIYLHFRVDRAKTVTVDDVTLIVNAPVEVATPYLEAELPALIVAQSADVMYICHEAHPVHKLLRFSNTTWSVVEVDFIDGPYLDENPEDTLTLQPSASTGLGITITANSAAGINDGAGFFSSDIGRPIRIKHGDNWGYAVITAIDSATQVTADVKRDFGATSAQQAWRLGSWSFTTGFPRALAFFEQRLVFAGSSTEPQTKWYSQSDDFESHEPDSVPTGGGARQIEDDDALTYTIAADQVNAIRWLKPLKELVIGTVGGEWVVQSDGPLLTPTDVDVKRRTAFGSADNVLPVLPRGRLMFLQRARRKILEFTFSFELDNFQALDQTLLADHVSKGGLIEMAYQQELDSVIWCVRADGQMPTLTFQPEQQVIGWARQIVGGGFAGGDAVVEDVVIVPALNRDEVWIVVKRTIDGATRRYVELFAEAHEPGDDPAGACYVDSAIRGSFDPKVTTVTGLDHLEGETVSLLVDGAVHPPKTVSGGQVTLDFAGGQIVAGLKYRHRIKGLKIEAGSATGTAQGQIKRIESVNLVLLDAMNGAIGPSFDNLQPLFFRTVDDPMDTAVPLFTGEKVVEFGGDFESDPRIHIEGDAPGPFTLLALVPSVKTNKT